MPLTISDSTYTRKPSVFASRLPLAKLWKKAVCLGAAATLAGSAGSDSVQRLDLRHTEALRRAVGDGASRQNESHQRSQEEERHDRRPHHRRPGTLQPVAGVLCGRAAHPRTTPSAALSQPGGERSGAHEKQDGRAADGKRRPLREREITPQEILRQLAGRTRRGAGVGDRSAALEPRCARNVREHAEATGARVTRRPRTGATRRTADEHPGGGRDHGSDLGPGGRRSATLSLRLRCHELLRAHGRVAVVGGQAATRAHLETAQPLVANHADRGRQAGARWNPQLAALHARELERGHRNRATLAVARKLVAYLLAVDKSRQPFQVRESSQD